MPDLQRAIEIAVAAHSDQKRRNGNPYILHPFRVMLSLQDTTLQTVAALHDVVEDSEWTCDRLQSEGFSEEIVSAVDALTKREGEAYQAYLDRVAANALAVPVKLADLTDNMNLLELPTIKERDAQRFAKYRQAYDFLKSIKT